MVEAEGIPPTASVASVGPNIRYIGDYAYGYSGTIAVQSAALPLLEFTSGSGFIMGQIGIFTPLSSSNNAEIAVSLNGIDVIVFEVLNTTQGAYLNGFAPMDILIPPFTEFKITAVNVTSSAEMIWYATLVGRVYGAV